MHIPQDLNQFLLNWAPTDAVYPPPSLSSSQFTAGDAQEDTQTLSSPCLPPSHQSRAHLYVSLRELGLCPPSFTSRVLCRSVTWAAKDWRQRSGLKCTNHSWDGQG